jgi:WD40 repeat protein
MVWLTYVAARPDGEVLAVTSSEGWLGVWRPRENRIVATQELGAFVNKVGWTADGAHLLATAGDQLHVLSPDGSARVTAIETGHDELRTFAVHPSQPIVATTGGDGHVRLWDLPSGAKRGQVMESRANGSGGGTAIALADDAIFVGYGNGYYGTCDPDGSNPGGGQLFGANVASLALAPRAPGGTTFMAGGGKGKLAHMLVSPKTLMCIETWNDPPKPIAANTIDFAPDGKFVVACSDDTALVFDDTNDRAPHRLGNPFWSERKEWKQDYIVSAACFVPKTKLIATSHFTGCVKLWRGTTSVEVRFENGTVTPVKWPNLD